MDIGVAIPFSHRTPVDYIAAAARHLEDVGFASIWARSMCCSFRSTPRHIRIQRTARFRATRDGILDPFTALTFAAAHTSRIRLGTGICLVPQRQPVYTAKMVADLDYLSGGRFEFGVGIGWLREEFDNLQVSFRARARRCAEYIDAMKALWTQPVATFEGPTVQLSPCYLNPKPVQKPHPPILFGGESDAALQRVVTQGGRLVRLRADASRRRGSLCSPRRAFARCRTVARLCAPVCWCRAAAAHAGPRRRLSGRRRRSTHPAALRHEHRRSANVAPNAC